LLWHEETLVYLVQQRKFKVLMAAFGILINGIL
jgi:hypothetical protein